MAYRIKALHKANGWSQQALADRAGTSQSQIWKWESGRTDPSAQAAMRLAKAFGVSADYLLDTNDRKLDGEDWGAERLAATYRRLDERGKRLLLNAAEALEGELSVKRD